MGEEANVRYRWYKGYKGESDSGYRFHSVQWGSGETEGHDGELNPAPDHLFLPSPANKPKKGTKEWHQMYDWGHDAADVKVHNLARAILWSSTRDEDKVKLFEERLCLVLRAFSDLQNGQKFFLHENWMDLLFKEC
jgi:hypothetical protein